MGEMRYVTVKPKTGESIDIMEAHEEALALRDMGFDEAIVRAEQLRGLDGASEEEDIEDVEPTEE